MGDSVRVARSQTCCRRDGILSDPFRSRCAGSRIPTRSPQDSGSGHHHSRPEAVLLKQLLSGGLYLTVACRAHCLALLDRSLHCLLGRRSMCFRLEAVNVPRGVRKAFTRIRAPAKLDRSGQHCYRVLNGSSAHRTSR